MKKNSSSYCNAVLRSGGAVVFEGPVTGSSISPDRAGLSSLKGWQTVSFQIDKVDKAHHLSVRIGNEIVADVPEGSLGHRSESSKILYDVVGESCFAIDLVDNTGTRQTILDVPFLVEPLPEVGNAYVVMLNDLSQIHESLAQDMFARGYVSAATGKNGLKTLNLSIYIDKISRIRHHLSEAIEQIARQPSTELNREPLIDFYRTGDRLDYQSMYALMRGAHSRDDVRRNAATHKIPLRRPQLSIDIPEHRHIARGLRTLAEMCRVIKQHCTNLIPILRKDEEKWGEALYSVMSMSGAGHPNIAILEGYIQVAESLRGDFKQLLSTYSFLRDAQNPRTPFGPTPLFTGHTAYARAYRALRGVAELGTGFIEGESLRIHLKSMTTLYEYWCFYKVVEQLRELFGAPRGNADFDLVNHIYKPDLSEGQVFSFDIPDGRVDVAYEPSINPWNQARKAGDTLGATLTARPLRPDVFISIHKDKAPLSCMVMDAKSTSQYEPKRLREMSDYARQIFEIKTGRQPVRAVFAMHRDAGRPAFANIPGYFDHINTYGDAIAVGAIPAIPEAAGIIPISLQTTLLKFLGDHGVFSPKRTSTAPT